MLLNEFKNLLLREYDDYNYYNFGFDVSFDNINIPDDRDSRIKLEEYLSGNIDGDIGNLEDVQSIMYDDMLNVTGQIKLPSSISYGSYEKSPGELALDIYNNVLINIFNTSISDVGVVFSDETEKFK